MLASVAWRSSQCGRARKRAREQSDGEGPPPRRHFAGSESVNLYTLQARRVGGGGGTGGGGGGVRGVRTNPPKFLKSAFLGG